jgi:hypothetical protein
MVKEKQQKVTVKNFQFQSFGYWSCNSSKTAKNTGMLRGFLFSTKLGYHLKPLLASSAPVDFG